MLHRAARNQLMWLCRDFLCVFFKPWWHRTKLWQPSIITVWLCLQAIWSLYNPSENCVQILGTKSNTFPVGVGLHQGCPMSQNLWDIMGRISRRRHCEESVEPQNGCSASPFTPWPTAGTERSSWDEGQHLQVRGHSSLLGGWSTDGKYKVQKLNSHLARQLD